MTNAIGLGTGFHTAAYLSWQNCEHFRHKPLYQGKDRPPEELSQGLPGTLEPYNQWLEAELEYLGGHTERHVNTIMGFLIGFKRNPPMHDVRTNRFIWGGRNSHQVRAPPFPLTLSPLRAVVIGIMLTIVRPPTGVLPHHNAEGRARVCVS